ncbi:hypothetical protein D3C81_1847540 [compost metagenome]
MHLIYDIDFIFSSLRWYTYLINQVTDIVYGIIGCRIQFMNTERISILERLTAITCATGFGTCQDVFTIYCFS